ncbi:MAG: ribosomal protein S18-alanine N-acetyltransferase [Acidobacteriia bacterium]|nr:ribosomal protein S18-alanine N-acetyltransferase [Terriglobia bacterium]
MGPGNELADERSAISVRAMIPSDVTSLLSILQESPEASLWTESGILEFAALGMALVAEQNGAVAGFLIGRAAADEFEILNMAVARAWRRRGIAGLLVTEALRRARTSGARRAHLEVRASNRAAIGLYERHGFAPSGRRGEYYQHPPEDALLFTVELRSAQD